MTGRRPGHGTNQEAVRRHNLGTLLRHVHRSGGSSRAELTRLMGLNRSTIGGLVVALESLGLVEQTAPGDGPRAAGRPSAGVRPRAEGPFVVAVDVGVDRVGVARVGLGGRVLDRAEAALGGAEPPDRVAARLASLVGEVTAGAPAAAALVGLGIAVPGLVRRADGLVRLAPNLGWRDVPFGEIVRVALDRDVPVAVANEADLGALAEHELGAGTGVADLLYISGNVGIGAGIIAGGRPLHGSGGYAGEVGHLRFDPAGPECHCGNRGCWETAVGGPAIAEAIDCPPGTVARLDRILESLESAPEELRAIAVDVGRGLGDLVNAFDPTMVVMGGYFRGLHSLLGEDVERGLHDRALAAPLEDLRVVPPGLGADSVLIGAASMAFQPLFDDPVASLPTP